MRRQAVIGLLGAALLGVLPGVGAPVRAAPPPDYHVKNLRMLDADELKRQPLEQYGVLLPDAVKIMMPRFYRQMGSDLQLEPVLEMLVSNESTEKVLRVFITAFLKCHGGRFTKIEDRFVIDFDEGILPGGSRRILIRCGPFRSWGQLHIPRDSFLAVRVDKVYCPKGNSTRRNPHYRQY